MSAKASLCALVALTLLGPGCTSGGTGSSPATSPDPTDAGISPPAAAPGPHVLVISIDGMHGLDLERYTSAKPDSALAQLARGGVRYTNVTTPFPSDSFPGQLALFTGGTPRSTGVYYDLSYDRGLSPPGDCASKGAVIDFSEQADLDPNKGDGGGGLAVDRLPRDGARGCVPVYPHDFLRVNTAFEIVHQAGKRTAWLDKHLSYEVVQGPSGKGVDDLFNPESASKLNKTLAGSLAYDDVKVDALLAEIAGKDHTGTTPVGVPALFGMNFQAVSVAQKTLGAAYADAAGTPSVALMTAFDRTDASLAKIVAGLRAAGLWDSTTLIITAAHGDAPIDPSLRKRLDPVVLQTAIEKDHPGLLAHLTADDVALVWLNDGSKATEVAAALMANSADLGIDSVLSGDALAALFGANDPRTPDLIAKLQPGVLYAIKDNKAGEHGGASDDDRKVLLLVTGGGIGPSVVTEPVETRQVAPTCLQALGLSPDLLDAVRAEMTAVLPGIIRTGK